MIISEKIIEKPNSSQKVSLVSDEHRYANERVREQRVVDVFFENFSISDPDHGSISPILNAISLLIQKPIVMSLIGVKNCIGNNGKALKSRKEPFCKLITHSIRPNYKKIKFRQRKRENQNYSISDFYRESYGEFYYELRKEVESQFKYNLNIFPDIEIEDVRIKKCDPSLKTNKYDNYFELINNSNEQFSISIDGKRNNRSLIFNRLFVIFNFVKIHSDNEGKLSPYQILPLNSKDSASIERVFNDVKSDSRFGSAILENFLKNISDLDRKASVEGVKSYTDAEWLDEPLKDVMNDLFDDFQHSIILRSEAFSTDFNKPKQENLPNFLLAIRVPSSGTNHAVRLILSDQQLFLIKEVLTKECVGFDITRTEEILNFSQKQFDYERTIEYRALPFQETIGFWNLRNSRVNDLNINEQNAYQARRIIYAIIWGARGYDENELINFGDGLGITVFPFHFAGSPFAHVIHVTTSFRNLNTPENNFARWEENTLVYSGFLRAFSRKFRARLRTSIVRQCYVRTRKAFDWVQEKDARLNPSKLLPKIKRLNVELKRFAQTYPIRFYKLIVKNVETDEGVPAKPDENGQIGEAKPEKRVSNNSDEDSNNEPEFEDIMFLGKWGQESIHIVSRDNKRFFRDYTKLEMSYSKRIAKEISRAIAAARKNWSDTIDIAEREFISQCSYNFINCNLIFLISETGEFLHHNSWDIAYDFCRRFKPALSPNQFQNLDAVVAEFCYSQTEMESDNVVPLASYAPHRLYARYRKKTHPWIVSRTSSDNDFDDIGFIKNIKKVHAFLELNERAEKAKWPKIFLVNAKEFSFWDKLLRSKVDSVQPSPDGVTYYCTDGLERKYAGVLNLDTILPIYRKEIPSGNDDG